MDVCCCYVMLGRENGEPVQPEHYLTATDHNLQRDPFGLASLQSPYAGLQPR